MGGRVIREHTLEPIESQASRHGVQLAPTGEGLAGPVSVRKQVAGKLLGCLPFRLLVRERPGLATPPVLEDAH